MAILLQNVAMKAEQSPTVPLVKHWVDIWARPGVTARARARVAKRSSYANFSYCRRCYEGRKLTELKDENISNVVQVHSLRSDPATYIAV